MEKSRSQEDSSELTRVANLLSYLRSGDVAMPEIEFGPDEPGCLVRILSQTFFGFHPTMDSYRFMTMNYIDGFKYTVGNKFVSRKSQGEFMYLNLKDRRPLSDEENYFALECQDGGIWLSRSQEGFRSSTVVSVNGMPLGSDNNLKGAKSVDPSTAERKLVFGEIVTISFGGEGDEKKDFADFMFKAKRESAQRSRSIGTELASSSNTTSVDDVVDDNVRVVGIMDNPLVVQNIVGFLPTKNLKKMRLVSHLWNIECLKTLRPRVIVTTLDRMGWSDVLENESQTYISDYVSSSLSELKFPHWKIKLPIQQNCDHRTTAWEKKVVDDLNMLLLPELHEQNVKSLQLSSHLRSETSAKILEVLLRGLKNSLTTLNLKVDFNDKFLPPSLAKMEIPGLQFLLICLDRKPSSSTRLKPFTEGILPAMHNIQTLALRDPSSGTAAATCFSSLVLQGIAKIQAVGPHKFANLTSIVIDSEGISLHQIEPLSSLRQGSLKKLQVGEIMPRTPAAGETLIGFSAALERHSNTLEELTLIFNFKSHSRLTIPFPQAMKNLKNLSVNFILERGSRGSSEDRTLRFLFGRGEGGNPNSVGSVDRINYRRHFPSLTKLGVFPVQRLKNLSGGLSKWGRASASTTWEEFLPIAAGFLQSVTDGNGRVVPSQSIENVSIPILLDRKYHNVLDNFETNFPNAVLPAALATARRRRVRVWKDEEEEDPSWIE